MEKCWIFGKRLYICISLHTKVIKNMESISFRRRVIDMEVGESITIPVEEVGYTTIRGYASDLGFAYGRKYSTHRNRAEMTHTITRIA